MHITYQAQQMAVQTWARRVVALLEEPWGNSQWWAQDLGRLEGELMHALAVANDIEPEYLAAVSLAAKRRAGQSIEAIAENAHAEYQTTHHGAPPPAGAGG